MVTGGEVKILERIRTGEYEHREAAVTIYFDGDDPSRATDMAQVQVQRILGRAAGPAKPVAGPHKAGDKAVKETAATAAVVQTTEAVVSPNPAVVASQSGSGGATASAGVSSATAALEAALDGPQNPVEGSVGTKAETTNLDPLGEMFETPAKQVSDVELNEAASKKMQELGDKTKIVELLSKYVPPKTSMAKMPQTLRQSFLVALAELKK